jgi:hypothetical protein
MKTIKLMPDYQCCPLWDMTPGEYGDIDPMTLPIPELLQSQLMDWARVYDETLDMEDPVNSGFVTADAKDAFEAEGMRLADRLREELGPEFIVEVKVRAFVKAGAV